MSKPPCTTDNNEGETRTRWYPIGRNFRQLRRHDHPPQQLIPVDLREPRVHKYVARTVLHVPESRGRVALDGTRVFSDSGSGGTPTGRYRAVERRQTREHLEDERAQGVPVYASYVACVASDLREADTSV